MKNKKPLKILIGILCAVLLILVAVAAIILDSRSPDPIFGNIWRPTTPTEATPMPTEAETQPTQGTEPPTDPSEAPTAPTTEDPENSEDPTDPSGAPTTPTEENPTISTTQPTVPGTEAPTLSPEDPTIPMTETPTVSSTPTVMPTEAPEIGEDPTVPTDEQTTTPEVLPPSVDIPSEKDPETGEDMGISFPCQIPGYGLTIERIAPYSGMFVEDGSNVQVQNVAMLLVYNDGDSPVEYAQISVVYGDQTLLFDITALPVGEKLVVQEKTGKTLPEGNADSASALVIQRADMQLSQSMIQVSDNGDNTLTIQNLTDEMIPTARVFYKYYMEDEDIFVGGIAFTVRISRLAAGASVTIQPAHYTSQTSRVVMVLTYDSEV